MSRPGPEALVMGVGNLLWADEGFGVRCIESFARRYRVSDDVELLEGGTKGLALVNDLAEAKRILLFDAVDFGGEPGSLVTAHGADVPRFVVGNKMSLHQTSMMELLALAEVMADCPPDAITLVGCQPQMLEDYGGGLTDLVAAQVDPAIDAAKAVLESWGFEVTPASDHQEGLMPDAVGWQPYEEGRPSAEDACRIGDARVLAQASGA